MSDGPWWITILPLACATDAGLVDLENGRDWIRSKLPPKSPDRVLSAACLRTRVDAAVEALTSVAPELTSQSGTMSLAQSFRALLSHPELRRGARDMSPVMPGMLAWGAVTGVAMVKGGLSVPLALTMSLCVYSAGAQPGALTLMVSGAPLWVIIAATVCANLRFVIFSAGLRPYLIQLPFARRVLLGYLCADLSYILFIKRFSADPGPSGGPPTSGRMNERLFVDPARGARQSARGRLSGVPSNVQRPVSLGVQRNSVQLPFAQRNPRSGSTRMSPRLSLLSARTS